LGVSSHFGDLLDDLGHRIDGGPVIVLIVMAVAMLVLHLLELGMGLDPSISQHLHGL
jgi:hypothetical protein